MDWETNTHVLGSYDNLQESGLYYVSNVNKWDWKLEFLKLLNNYYVRLDVKRDCYTLQGLSKTNILCKHKFELQRFTI